MSSADLQEASKAKKAKSDSNNDELVKLLLEIGDYEKNVNRQVHKYNAYRKAAQSIKNYPHKITTVNEAKKIEGVGKKILEKIKQFIEDGKINKAEKIRVDDTANALKELTRVSGIGPSVAQKLFKEGIKSLEDLRKNQDKLNHAQKIGLKYVDDFEKRIPRKEMIEMETFIKKTIKELDSNFVVTICGSFRRGAESSGDIDVLLTHPDYVSSSFAKETKKSRPGLIIDSKQSPKPLIDKVVKELIRLKFITDTMALGETKFMGVCNIKALPPFRRLDIRLIPSDQYYCGVLYFTGSDVFNRDMRKKALDTGYTLNEYSLRKISSTGIPGKAIEVNSEEDIFKQLGMEYCTPEQRNA